MKRPAVFFDRDNTLIVSDGYLGDPSKVVLVEGAADAIARARELGYAVVVFSNQSGVARGMFSEEDVTAVNARMDELLIAENPAAIIDRHEFCPFHPEGTIDVYARESDRRKPKPGMILSAAEKLALDLSRSWVIGDASRDIAAGKAAGCRAILFTDTSLNPSPAAAQPPTAEPDYVVATLAEAVAYIERNPDPAQTPVVPTPTIRINTSASRAASAAASTTRIEMPAPAAPVVAAAASTPSTVHNTADIPDAPAPAPTPRVPKVAIGSKYVPPTGGRTVSMPAPAAREEANERPAAAATQRRAATRAAEEDSSNHTPPPATPTERMESLLEQIFLELRRQHEHQDADFSVSKLLAGIVQVIVLAILFMAYLKRGDAGLQTYLMLSLILQTLTISLLIMSRQK